jgi:hypothetical protein
MAVIDRRWFPAQRGLRRRTWEGHLVRELFLLGLLLATLQDELASVHVLAHVGLRRSCSLMQVLAILIEG